MKLRLAESDHPRATKARIRGSELRGSIILFCVLVALSMHGVSQRFGFVISLVQAAHAEEVFVQVASAALRGSPQHWGRSIAQVRYGDALSVMSTIETATDGVPGWLEVKKGPTKGFIHRSAVTDRRVVIAGRAGGSVNEVKSGDVVLAGKGFNAEVEGEYAARNRNANFSAVDRMLARKISDGEVSSFINSGKLGGTR